jgi:nucleotide-binding universal stress UspA family protein
MVSGQPHLLETFNFVAHPARLDLLSAQAKERIRREGKQARSPDRAGIPIAICMCTWYLYRRIPRKLHTCRHLPSLCRESGGRYSDGQVLLGTLPGHDAAMSRFVPGTLQAILEFAGNDLRAYLAQQVSRIQQAGVQATAELRQGDPAIAIPEAAEALDASVIILATHGRAGNAAFWTNSVGARVQAQTRRPLLLIPVREETPALTKTP